MDTSIQTLQFELIKRYDRPSLGDYTAKIIRSFREKRKNRECQFEELVFGGIGGVAMFRKLVEKIFWRYQERENWKMKMNEPIAIRKLSKEEGLGSSPSPFCCSGFLSGY